ncbi:MAG: stage III sporulation protein AA [Lachnospiraceae bacterium]|jgi:stage III sporulation protein AA|nr:stage III sporulation protein AA [Lachnospiraceae bacterium]
MNNTQREEQIMRVLAVSLRQIFKKLSPDYDRLEEIRLRIGSPLTVTYGGLPLFVSKEGQFCGRKDACPVEAGQLRETMDYLSSYSRYAFESQIRQGYLTVAGGHRVGLGGHVVMEDGRVKTISPVTFLNIRIAREVPGCGQEVVPWLWDRGRLCDTLVVSAPGLGKTTLLRDIIRILSDGDGERGCTVGVVDERSELAACIQGVPQNDLGSRTDVLDGCSKAEGMLMLVRSMSPRVIAVDEVGGEEDCRAMEYVMNCGCCLIGTAHGIDLSELKGRPVFGRWMREERFERYVLIERGQEGISYRVCGRDGRTLWRGKRPS